MKYLFLLDNARYFFHASSLDFHDRVIFIRISPSLAMFIAVWLAVMRVMKSRLAVIWRSLFISCHKIGRMITWQSRMVIIQAVVCSEVRIITWRSRAGQSSRPKLHQNCRLYFRPCGLHVTSGFCSPPCFTWRLYYHVFDTSQQWRVISETTLFIAAVRFRVLFISVSTAFCFDQHRLFTRAWETL